MSSSSSNNTWSSTYEVFGTRRARMSTGVKCDCDIVAPCWEAWRAGTADPGRRFYGCSRFRDPRLKCNFFEWLDPPYTERAREVIENLMKKLSARVDEVMILREDLESLKSPNGRLAELEKELEEKEECLAMMEKNLKMKNVGFKVVVLLLLVSWVLIFIKNM